MRDRCFIYLYIFLVYIHKHIVNDNRLNFMANYLQYSMWVVTINRGLSTMDNRGFRDDNFIVNDSKILYLYTPSNLNKLHSNFYKS